jgi:protein TonB
MTVKDPVPVLEPKSGAPTPARRDAVGAEIPVTVHASRTTQGLGKNLPAVHEDTKTVIVLQQGAVVRLTASLFTGETVVLTNRMTGADALCRVGNVKSQPGIQHYVDLEFMQRTPGFWGDAVAASGIPMVSQAPAAMSPPPAPTAPIAAPVAVLPRPAAPVSAPPPPPASVAAPPPAPVAVAPPPVFMPPAPPAPAPVVDFAPAAEPLQPAPLAEPVTTLWNAPQSDAATPVHHNMRHSTFGSIGTSGNSSGSQKALLAVAAALLLVLGGAAGGYWFYGRQAGAVSSPAVQQAAAVPAVHPTPELTGLSAPVSAPLPDLASAASPARQTDIFVESRPVNDVPGARVQPPLVSVAHTAPVRRNLHIEQLKAPKAKMATARLDSSEAPPAMMGTLNVAADNSLLAAAAAGPAPPPVSPRPVGGQIQPPQLLTSKPPVYPPNARLQRVQGVVVLDAIVDETGKVVETTVISGPPPLWSAAQEAVRTWQYKPAQLNGKPITVHAKISARFSLQ